MNISINNQIFSVSTLVDPKSHKIGMMGKRFKSHNEGMLFLMGGDEQCFWMKNCIIPLDIIIIKNNVIVNIHHDCPPCSERYCPSYCGNGNIVLELEGGTCKLLGIEPGDTIKYLLN
jgi:uncharacterized membrane protein (UPF0127 family)